jgi:hypothetical protein
MVMEMEKCTNCKEEIVLEKSVKKNVSESTFKFCSEACADAYKESVTRRGEEIKEQDKKVLVSGWGVPL